MEKVGKYISTTDLEPYRGLWYLSLVSRMHLSKAVGLGLNNWITLLVISISHTEYLLHYWLWRHVLAKQKFMVFLFSFHILISVFPENL